MVLQCAKPLPSLPRGFPIRTLITQPAYQRAHLLLALADRVLQSLTALFLSLCGLLFLLLPALQQLLMQKLGVRANSAAASSAAAC